MIKIAITDDHPIVIDGLLNALHNVPGMEVVATYNNGAELLKGLQEQFVDVLPLDLQLPDRNGAELVPIILNQYPDMHILILSGVESSAYIKEMIQKGCKGYLLKSNTGKPTLIAAIHEVYKGGVYLESAVKEQLLHEMLIAKRKLDKINPKITQRELEVLHLIME